MMTRLTSRYPVTGEYFDELLVNELKPYIREYMSNLGSLTSELRKIYAERYILFTDENLCFDSTKLVFYPNFDTWEITLIDDYKSFDYDKFLEQNLLLSKAKNQIPNLSWLKSVHISRFFVERCWIVSICDDEKDGLDKGEICFYNIYKDELVKDISSIKEPYIIGILPIVKIDIGKNKQNNFVYFLENVLCEYNLCPLKLTDLSKRLLISYNKMRRYIYFEDEIMQYDTKLIGKELMEGKIKNEFSELHGHFINILKQYKDSRNNDGIEIDAKEDLLSCEKIRADIEPYEERILTDPNRGHWDLWFEDYDDTYTIQMETEYVARNPRYDINENGVIAIDFGTKSTIVVYQGDIEHSLPMGIGDGNLTKAPTPKRYENPTVMQFVNLEKFLQAYKGKDGRPDTVWEDLPISHTAMDKFANSKSEEYYAFMHQIKQWAGRREKQFRIQPIVGESLLLPAFMDLKEDDLNPIEIYAYYIGLYINNMRKGHGIFLDYYLSFPVTYEVKIRQKIVESFERGLKKSLPVSIQKEQELMEDFKVNGDISEPAAYAVCALQEYGFEPKEDEEIFYGIFDFGGGTTDFDFGIWKNSSKRRYDYTISNFGAGGDEFLGGENLLEMLAFEIFKENQAVMRAGNYNFTLAPKATEFLGSDALLSDSQEAEKNMHNLMEVLRPYWEKEDLYLDNKYEDGEIEFDASELVAITSDALKWTDKLVATRSNVLEGTDNPEDLILKVSLFDKYGKDHPNVELVTNLQFIEGFIEFRIREGVKNFFAALMLSYQAEQVKKSETVNVFLAGNSCRSPVVKKVFYEEIAIYEKLIREKYDLKETIKMFEIFPPLGSKEAYKKMEERGIPYKEDDFEKPTGKTGVAFGLLQCRVGGAIERIANTHIDSEIAFQYFLGWQSKRRFVLFKDDKITKFRGKPDYGQWYKFIEADLDTFYLYYTSLPECVNGDLIIDGNPAVKRIKCNIDVVYEDAHVYIKAISPHSIQYAVAKEYDVENNLLGQVFTKELT